MTKTYRGVSWNRRDCAYRVKVKHDGRHYNFGYHEDPVYAAKIFDAVVAALRGPDASTNFFPPKPPNDMTMAQVHRMMRSKGLEPRFS